MPEPETITLACTRATFQPAAATGVRWLAPQADFYRWQQFLRTCGEEPPTFAEWQAWHQVGCRFCALTPGGIITARAGLRPGFDSEAELTDLRTLPAEQGKGLENAVATFITHAILSERERALCRLAPDDTEGRALLERLGYQPL